jgi:micrococcal nuclease
VKTRHALLGGIVVMVAVACAAQVVGEPTTSPSSGSPAISTPVQRTAPTASTPPTSAPNPWTDPSPAPAGQTVKAAKLVDGDTLHVTLPDGTDDTVRFIGINAPEITKGKNECLGQEAKQFVADAVTESDITITADPTQADRDRYGRAIRYVGLVDGTDLQKELIAAGLVQETQYAARYQRQTLYVEVERLARVEQRGGWASAAVGGCGWKP